MCIKVLELGCVLGYSVVPGSQCGLEFGSDPGLVTFQWCHKTSPCLRFFTSEMEITTLCSEIIVRRIRCIHIDAILLLLLYYYTGILIIITKTQG